MIPGQLLTRPKPIQGSNPAPPDMQVAALSQAAPKRSSVTAEQVAALAQLALEAAA